MNTILILVLILYLLLPLGTVLVYSLFDNWTGILPHGFTTAAYQTLFQEPVFRKALGETLLLCIVPILVTTLVMLLALFVVLVYYPRLEKYVQIICMIPYTIQGIILSVSILSLYNNAGGILGNRILMLMGAYCVIILPYIYQGIRNGMRSIRMTTLLEAAELLGSTRLSAFFRIVVPNILSGVTVSALLSVGILFGDYVLIRNIAGSKVTNLQMYLYQSMKSDSMKSSAVFVVIMAITFLISAVVLLLQKKEKKNRG